MTESFPFICIVNGSEADIGTFQFSFTCKKHVFLALTSPDLTHAIFHFTLRNDMVKSILKSVSLICHVSSFECLEFDSSVSF